MPYDAPLAAKALLDSLESIAEPDDIARHGVAEAALRTAYAAGQADMKEQAAILAHAISGPATAAQIRALADPPLPTPHRSSS